MAIIEPALRRSISDIRLRIPMTVTVTYRVSGISVIIVIRHSTPSHTSATGEVAGTQDRTTSRI